MELRVALIQSPLEWENPSKNREHFSKKLDTLNGEVDLVILPEMFTTAFTMTPWNIAKEEGEITVKWMQKEAGRRNVALTGSMVYFEDGHYYNRLWFVEPDGKSGYYDKRHTFTLAGEDKIYNKGGRKIVIDYKGFRICPLICYDLRFPVWARNTENYDVLIYVANWPHPRVNAWDALLKARAIENMAYVIGVNRIGTDNTGHNYSGHSTVNNVYGEPIAFSKEEKILYATLVKRHISEAREKLKFLEDRDHFSLKV
ncbi:amidohydrolase [Arenibacter troitsensis]|uniref:Omega-amidase YafV n=1 Tax=Arenibacter troitsensis TaxID=188872 RepID=A0A1X7JU21_9FLAO|nr:amidohydrolase [Arenibacter troitsensis]SMG31872.1 Carbon-nitrogen hydrolase [Arenibacter troitsensis]